MAGEILTVNQVVAFNLRRARDEKGWTQSEAAVQLAPFLGDFWSRQRFSAAERAYSGETERGFSIDEVLAFARGFSFSVGYFLTPPPGCLQVTTAPPTWFIYFQDDDLPEEHRGVPMSHSGFKPPTSADFKRPIKRIDGPHWPDRMEARQLLGLLGNAEAPAVASRLRALADEIEKGSGHEQST
jgi:hypothetical protein